MYRLLFHPRTEKQLKKLPPSWQKRILARVEELAENPFAKFDVKKLAQTERSYRLRLGGMRIIYEIDQETQTLYLQEINFRGQVY